MDTTADSASRFNISRWALEHPALTLYLMHGFDVHADLLKKLGKYKTGMGCLYIKTLDDVDRKVLKELLQASVKRMKQLSK